MFFDPAPISTSVHLWCCYVYVFLEKRTFPQFIVQGNLCNYVGLVPVRWIEPAFSATMPWAAKFTTSSGRTRSISSINSLADLTVEINCLKAEIL